MTGDARQGLVSCYDVRHGRLVLDVGDTSYPLHPLDALAASLATCPPEHRDALLDARLAVYDESGSPRLSL